MNASSASATDSISISLRGSILLSMSSGTGASTQSFPLYTLPTKSTILTNPLKESDSPIGTAKGTILLPNLSLSSLITLS